MSIEEELGKRAKSIASLIGTLSIASRDSISTMMRSERSLSVEKKVTRELEDTFIYIYNLTKKKRGTG